MPGLSSYDLLSDNKNFAIESLRYHKNINMKNMHYHSHYEILYIQSGKRILTINNSLSYTLDSHNIALIKPNILHYTVSSGDSAQQRVLINISPEFMEKISSAFSSNIYSCFNMPVLDISYYEASMLNYLFAELIENKPEAPFYNEKIKVNLSKILMLLSEAYLNSGKEHELLYANQNNNDRVDYMINYFQKNFNTNISIDELAEQLLCTPTYLARIFKKVTGTTPYKYLENIRIINAQKLLRSHCMSVSDIAVSCGFNSLMSFSRSFKAIHGCSPKEYQRNIINS